MTYWTIDSLTVPDTEARIGLCPYPGSSGSLSNDVTELRDWGARGLVTLIEDQEFAPLGLTSLPEKVAALGMHWWHLPIRNMDTPNENFEVRWRETGKQLRELLNEGASIAVHCHGGLGRTGTIAARLLVELGTPPTLAIERIRAARPGSIETSAQEQFIHHCRAPQT